MANLSEHKELRGPRVTVSESLAIRCRIRKCHKLSGNNAAVYEVCPTGEKQKQTKRQNNILLTVSYTNRTWKSYMHIDTDLNMIG